MTLASIWIATVVAAVANISDPVKIAVKASIIELDKKARNTPNPWDNIFVTFLAGILGVDLEETKKE